MISLSNVSKWYFGQTRVLNQVNLELKKGEFLYVVGGSGAGKSSLLRIMATQEVPSEGKVSIFGYDLETVSNSTLRAIRQSLGFIPQDLKLIQDLSVLDNITMSLSLSGKKALSVQSRAKISELLNRLGLEAKRNTLVSMLSGGEAQRVAVARALVRSPALVIADEPTGAQDRDFTWSLMELFMKANLNGSSIVVATHDREIVRRVRKKCAILKGGHVTFEEALCIY